MNTKIQLILASGSPRRKELLKKTEIPFETASVDIDESPYQTGNPADAVSRLSQAKMEAFLKKEPQYKKNRWIVTADTLVSYKNIIMGKPVDRKEAKKFLTLLSGNIHQVLTSISLYNPVENKIIEQTERTDVHFVKIDQMRLNAYLNTDEWTDAAGAYKIQGKASLFVHRINGSYENVMGLPLCLFYDMLVANHFPFQRK